MSAPKYKPGDPVWARHTGYSDKPKHITLLPRPAGEYPAVIVGVSPYFMIQFEDSLPVYMIDLEGESSGWLCREDFLRPRRDDYQQHEPRTTREGLNVALQVAALRADSLSKKQETPA